jgi:2-polyprenyl-6-methoxyphenol hydroxylase-like FAD-dependent oxidoreductase
VTDLPVVVVGGGPVGLLLAALLRVYGVDCAVLERRLRPSDHSRAIGVHPPSLELLDRLGLAAPLVRAGVAVARGVAFADGRRAATLDFRACPPPFRFVLSVPQETTEAVLSDHLARVAPGALRRGVEVHAVAQDAAGVTVTATGPDGQDVRLRARWVVGCDGRDSLVRQSAGVGFPGRAYPDSFLLADFDDDTDLGTDAAIHLHRDGLVECFPLPGGRRRWVVATPSAVSPAPAAVSALVAARLGHSLAATPCHRVTAFSLERRLAPTFAVGRLALAGDAAHLVSPIGGQGMNLGWMDARDLARILAAILHEQAPPAAALAHYSARARARADRVAARTELNLRLGRATRLSAVRGLFVRLVGASPARHVLARLFTMRGV